MNGVVDVERARALGGRRLGDRELAAPGGLAAGAAASGLAASAAGLPIASTSGGRGPLGPGIDIRGPGRRSGGYLVGPGSAVSGRPYTLVHDTVIRDLPAWLAALLTRPRTAPRR
jgi:hypothetical protein